MTMRFSGPRWDFATAVQIAVNCGELSAIWAELADFCPIGTGKGHLNFPALDRIVAERWRRGGAHPRVGPSLSSLTSGQTTRTL